MTNVSPTVALPNGKYVARYQGDRELGQCVAAEFEVSVGEYVGRHIQMLICTKKAAQAVRERSGLWLEWMAYEGDAKASKVLDATLNSVAGYIIVDVEDGQVTRTSSPARTESSFNAFLKQMCELWKLRTGVGANQHNLEACQRYRGVLGSLPRLWGKIPGEQDLRRWLSGATDPSNMAYFHAASIWLNAVYIELGGLYERADARSWPVLLKNNGFDRPPKRPRSNVSEV